MTRFLMMVFFLGFATTALAQGSLDAERVYLFSGGVSRMNISTGSGAPSGGTNGDYYIDYNTSNLYRRVGGSWEVVPMVSLTNTWTALQTFSGGMTITTGLTAGSGAVGIINSTGKIPALTSTYFASLDGSVLTNLNASNIATGNLPYARMPTGAGTWTGTPTISGTTTFSANLMPSLGYTSNIGALTTKFLQLHAAELVVETLVAQNTLATIGGRVLVAPTNILTADMSAASTTITVKYNNFVSGDRIYLEENGAVEWMAVTTGAGGSPGAYTYSVTRNLDGSGANTWPAGAAALDTGTTGNGFIDLYSTAGVLSGTGPTIVGNVRTGTTYNNIAARWAAGNLRSIYNYGSGTDVYGFAAGDPSATYITMDATNGFRIRNSTTDKFKADTAGNLYLTGNLEMGTAGIFYSAGVSGFTAGTGWWLDYNAGTPRFRVGDPSGNRLSWDGTDLKLVSANLLVDATGVHIAPLTSASSYDTAHAFDFTAATGTLGMAGWDRAGGRGLAITSSWTGAGNRFSSIALTAADSGTHSSTLTLAADAAGTSATAQLSANSSVFLSGGGSSIALNTSGINLTGTLVGNVSGFDVEIGSTSASNTPVIDWHSSGNAIDYDSRIIASGGTGSSGNGVLTVFASDFRLSNGSVGMTLQPGFFGSNTATNVVLMANSSTIATVCNGGGLTVGAPTGGCQGAGTINVATGLYLNGVAYTNPSPDAIANLEARIAVLEAALVQKGGQQ